MQKTFENQVTYQSLANGTKVISTSDLENILKSLGVPVTQKKVHETLLALAEGASAKYITLDKIKEWWNRYGSYSRVGH